jgi:hypothetical protein
MDTHETPLTREGEHVVKTPPQKGSRKQDALPLEGERVVETSAQKYGRVHGALPLEGKRECSTMPQQSPCVGELAALKGIAPNDLEGDLPWDPGGEENIEHKVDARPQERHTAWHRNACTTGRMVWRHGAEVGSGPEESVKEHHNKVTTHLYRGVDPFPLEAH